MTSAVKSFIDKYKAMSAPVKASLWFIFCNIMQKGISLLSTPIFTRILTTEQYGVYTVYQSWHTIIAIFATLNLSYGVFNNGMTKFSDDRAAWSSSMHGLSTLLTGILCVVYFLFSDFWTGVFELSPLIMSMMFLQMFLDPAYSFWAAEQRYDYKYKNLVLVTLGISLATPILGIISVSMVEAKAEARIISYVAVWAFAGLILYIRALRNNRRIFRKEYWKFALTFNIPLIPHYLSTTLLNQADRIMISRMVGKGEAAIYSVAYTIAMMMVIVTNAINNSFIPYTYKELKEKRYDGIRKNADFLLLLVGIACVLAMAFAPEIIRIFASAEYYEAIWVMPPIAGSAYFLFLYPLFGNIEFYFEKTKFVAVASSIAAAANLVLNYIFIGWFGYFAAGYTTLACYIIYAVAHYFFHKKVMKEKIPEVKEIYNMKMIFLVSGIVFAAMILMAILYNHIVIRYAVILAVLVVIYIKRNLIMSKLKEIKKK